MLRRLLLLRKRQTIPNRQVIRIPEQITILLLLPVEVTASRQLCRIPNHRSRLHCRIRKVRRIPHRPYIVHRAIRRNHSLPQSVESWIKNRYRNSRSQRNRIHSVRVWIRNRTSWNQRIKSDRSPDQRQRELPRCMSDQPQRLFL